MNAHAASPSRSGAAAPFWMALACAAAIVASAIMPRRDYSPFVEEPVLPPYDEFRPSSGTLLKIDFPPAANRASLYFASPGALPAPELLSPGFRVTILHENPASERSFRMRRTIGQLAVGLCVGAFIKLLVVARGKREFASAIGLLSLPASAVAMTAVTIYQPSTPGEWLPPEEIVSLPLLALFHVLPALVVEAALVIPRWTYGNVRRPATEVRGGSTPEVCRD